MLTQYEGMCVKAVMNTRPDLVRFMMQRRNDQMVEHAAKPVAIHGGTSLTPIELKPNRGFQVSQIGPALIFRSLAPPAMPFATAHGPCQSKANLVRRT